MVCVPFFLLFCTKLVFPRDNQTPWSLSVCLSCQLLIFDVLLPGKEGVRKKRVYTVPKGTLRAGSGILAECGTGGRACALLLVLSWVFGNVWDRALSVLADGIYPYQGNQGNGGTGTGIGD